MRANPNVLLVVIMLIALASNAILLARVTDLSQAAPVAPTPTATPAPTPTPLPVDDHSDGVPVGRDNARLVYDHHCASGVGWQWFQSVEDGQGGENLIMMGSCTR